MITRSITTIACWTCVDCIRQIGGPIFAKIRGWIHHIAWNIFTPFIGLNVYAQPCP